FFFFFSSRRRHTRCYRDWSSDVCSSDLGEAVPRAVLVRTEVDGDAGPRVVGDVAVVRVPEVGQCAGLNRRERLSVELRVIALVRSEERRVGKEGRCRVWSEEGE